jgi:DNA (cytosine-5)-methyltransferase 1
VRLRSQQSQLSFLPSRGARPTRRSARRVDVDLFAGGGGAGEGKRRATGKSADVAVNHWPAAISMYSANHETTRVMIEDVRDVQPLEATLGLLVRYLWASPTCAFFSRASGKRLSPEAVKIRALADVLIPWLRWTLPEIAIVENVVEFLGWGPVYDTHHKRCRGRHDESGDSCSKHCKYGRPIPKLKGTLFAAWRAAIEALGYSFEYRVLKAWEYGAPTTRERVYIVMCANGRAFEWPEPTHVRPELATTTGRKPWRTAAEIIDWSIPCPSIFDRKKPHVEATRARIARGMRKFVLEAERPFLMHLTHGERHAPHNIDEPVPTVTAANRGEQAVVVPSFVLPVKSWGGGGNDARSLDLPMRTITASKRGEFALAVPYMIHRGNGEREGQDPRVYDVRAPYPTVVAGGIKAQPVVAFLAKAYTESSEGATQATDLDRPISTVTAQDHHHLVAASLVKFYGTSTGSRVDEPVHTITANDRGGGHVGVVAASLLRYNGQSTGQRLDDPIGTIDTTDRYAQVQYPIALEWNDIIAAKARRVYRFLDEEGVDGPWMDRANQLVRLPGTELVIYDIGMRMLGERELFRAQGFSDSYVLHVIGPKGKPLTKTELVRLAGNSVCPDVAEALWRAAMRMHTPRTRRAA